MIVLARSYDLRCQVTGQQQTVALIETADGYALYNEYTRNAATPVSREEAVDFARRAGVVTEVGERLLVQLAD